MTGRPVRGRLVPVEVTLTQTHIVWLDPSDFSDGWEPTSAEMADRLNDYPDSSEYLVDLDPSKATDADFVWATAPERVVEAGPPR